MSLRIHHWYIILANHIFFNGDIRNDVVGHHQAIIVLLLLLLYMIYYTNLHSNSRITTYLSGFRSSSSFARDDNNCLSFFLLPIMLIKYTQYTHNRRLWTIVVPFIILARSCTIHCYLLSHTHTCSSIYDRGSRSSMCGKHKNKIVSSSSARPAAAAAC